MPSQPTPRPAARQRSLTDGWLGTLEFPGYRAGPVVARLDDLPAVDAKHLYLDLLLLDDAGRTQDFHSGACSALARQQSLDERSRFVRLVVELVRHAAEVDRSLTALGQALNFIRESGVELDRLITAAQLIDNASSERAVAASLNHMLALSLGEEEATRTLCEVVGSLAGGAAVYVLDESPPSPGADAPEGEGGALEAQVTYVVRAVGKTRARRFLREATDFELVPRPDMFGV